MSGEAPLGEKVSNAATLFSSLGADFLLYICNHTHCVQVSPLPVPVPWVLSGVSPSENWGVRAVLVPVDLEPSSGFYPERQVRRLPL